jgi:hypothetical protein
MDPSSALPTNAPSGAPRLDSWKEIAAYLKRDVRTVRRWEATEGLPVHRHLHRARHSVYVPRIDAWWDNGRRVAEEPPAARERRSAAAGLKRRRDHARRDDGSPLVHERACHVPGPGAG